MTETKNRSGLVGSISTCLLLLSACTSGPDYRPPEVSLAPYHNRGQSGDAAAGLDRWWIGFHDPELTHIIERALAENLDLAAAMARVDQARAAARYAGAALLPTVDAVGSETVQHQSLESPLGKLARHAPGYDRDQSLHDVGAAASWEIDLSGGLRRDEEAAKDLAQAAEDDHAYQRITVAADASDAYFQIRGFQARIALAEAQIEADRHLVNLVHLRLGQGDATERESAQAKALLDQAHASLPPLRRGLEAQLNRLDVLMGAQPGTYAKELASPSPNPSIPPIEPGDSIDLLRRRPDVLAAERRLAASNAKIGSALSEYYPKLSLTGLLGFESLSGSHLLTGGAFQPAATAGLRWRLFDFGRVDSEVEAAKGTNAEALAQYRQSILKAAEDVEDALSGLSQDMAQSKDLEQETFSLVQARDRAEEAYRGGAVALIDVIDSDRQLLFAQDSLALSQADTERAAVSVYRSLGGGW